MVWADDRGGSDRHIYYKKLDSGQNGRVTGYNSDQEFPAISGSTVVWQDWRDGPSTSHLYYKKLDTGQTVRVTGINSIQQKPKIN